MLHYRKCAQEGFKGRGVAERSESSNKMIAGGNHTATDRL